MPSIRFCLLFAGVIAAALVGRAAMVGGSANPEAKAAGLVPAKLERLDALLRDAVQRRQIAGGVALLARHGRIGHLHAIGWRDAEAKTPMTTDTLFRIASMTKPVTSVAVMMLVEEGKLQLTDPVSKFIPEFGKAIVGIPDWFGGRVKSIPALREITIRDLLNHTSGLGYRFWNIQPWTTLYRQAGISDGLLHPPGGCIDNVRRLARQPLLFQPGTFWGYGLSTDVLGVLVELVSGQDLATFFQERIFGPLQMHDTFFFVPPAQRDRLAALYLRGRDGKRQRVGDETVAVGELQLSATYPCEPDGKYFSGGAGLVSTAADYARFLQMLLNGGELDGARLLQPATIAQMTKNQIGYLRICFPQYGDRYGYGFGVRTEGDPSRDAASFGSYAWGGVFHTYFWVDPKKDLIGMMMLQLFALGDLPLRQEFKQRAYECLAD
ncbi:MAG TPA: serine hydrolase domain-containing protein [Gemmataceae bacterium]|nr:serine hydrolase domain-containing protein [Gemmataceae bacterium]